MTLRQMEYFVAVAERGSIAAAAAELPISESAVSVAISELENIVGVRLLHRPSGIVVTATERRSQHANREMAFQRMAERLEERQKVTIPRKPTRPTLASRRRRLEGKRHASQIKRQRSVSPE